MIIKAGISDTALKQKWLKIHGYVGARFSGYQYCSLCLSAAQNWLKENRRTDRPVSAQIKQSHTKENTTVLTYFNAGQKKKKKKNGYTFECVSFYNGSTTYCYNVFTKQLCLGLSHKPASNLYSPLLTLSKISSDLQGQRIKFKYLLVWRVYQSGFIMTKKEN